MTRQWATLLLCFCVALLASCGSGPGSQFLPPPTPPPSPTPTPTPPPLSGATVTVSPGWVLLTAGQTEQFTATVANTNNTAVIWQVGGVTGGNATLGTISSTGLYTAPADPPHDFYLGITAALAADTSYYGGALVSFNRDPHFAYVSSGSDDTIQGFLVKETSGVPTPISLFSLASGTNPAALAMHPGGRFLYSLNRGSNDISIFDIDDQTGDLTPAGSVPTPNGPYAMVFSPAGDYAYLSCNSASSVAAFSVDKESGALTPLGGSPYPLGTLPEGLTVTPDGKFLYVTDPGASKIIGLAIDPNTGTLSQLAGSPFSAGAGVASIVTSPIYAPGYLYAANRDSGTIGSYTYDRTSGSLTLFAEIPSGGDSPEFFADTSYGFLVGVNSGSDNVFSYELDGELYSYHPPVGTAHLSHPGGILQNPAYYPWAYVLNSQSGTSAASIIVYHIYYDGLSQSVIATVPTASNNPTGFAITP